MIKRATTPKPKLQEMLDECACLNLRQAARSITQRYDDALRPLGLRSTQLPILVAASLRGPVELGALAEELVIDATTLSRNIALLDRAGWLELAAGDDRRTRVVTVTDLGQQIVAKAVPLWQQAQDDFVGSLGEDRFAQLLSSIVHAVDAARG